MIKTFRNFLVFSVFLIAPLTGYAVQNLVGSASVNVASDTASNAKNMAFNEARRQIIADVVSKYTDGESFKALLKKASDDELTNLVSSTSIDGERSSATTYSANIKMTLDVPAAKKWLNDNNVQNWLGTTASVDMFMMTATLSNGLADWIELNRAARLENVDINVTRISGTRVIAEIPVSGRQMFTIAVREAGWKYSDDNGMLRIWK